MKKAIFILLISIFSSLSLNADFLLANQNICIKDYYYKNWVFYYHMSNSPLILRSSATKGFQPFIFPGFDFNSTSKICTPPVIPQKLGIQYHEYKFLMALLGLLLGSSFLFALLRIFSRK